MSGSTFDLINKGGKKMTALKDAISAESRKIALKACFRQETFTFATNVFFSVMIYLKKKVLLRVQKSSRIRI